MTFWLLLILLSPLLTSAWTPSLNLPNGGRSAAGGGSAAFLLRSGRTNRDTDEFSVLQESPVLFHLYDNILDEPWASISAFDRLDELDIISSSPSLVNYWDDASPCYGEECEVGLKHTDRSLYVYFYRVTYIYCAVFYMHSNAKSLLNLNLNRC
jgi:hypothetical protein